MPYKEKEITKLYYSIGEVSKMFDVSPSLLRYWESEFSQLSPKKNRKGNRLFMDKDIDILKLIFNLVKERGYTLEGAKQKLKSGVEVEDKNLKVIESLQRLKSFLAELQKQL